MAELYLVRHGQASFGAANYDQLSEMGAEQCRLLGEYFRERGLQFDRVVCGNMQRHHQSAQAIFQGLGQGYDYQIHAGFNEFDFQTLLKLFSQHDPEQGIKDWRDAREVYRGLRQAMLAWSQQQFSVDGEMETWQQFHQRVADGLELARQPAKGKTLVVTSGGPICIGLSQMLDFNAQTSINLNLQCLNSAFSHCFYNKDSSHLSGFNAIPHLDTPAHRHMVSYS
ncbi:histidine phosphatase family protein [Vibrio sp.]|uniref:histidine phosphatase family protein n=1 Tax=Vibrio sp. TaxID=678 RepID=UPI003D113862